MPHVKARKTGDGWKALTSAQLNELGMELANFMRLNKGGSAMVRVWVDERGRTMLAANFYVQNANSRGAREPSVQFRKVVDFGG